MAEQIQAKVPIQRLFVTAAPKKKGRMRRTVSEKAENKKALDKARAQTRVNIGLAFQRWRQLRDLEGLQSDTAVAIFLLDSFEKQKKQAGEAKDGTCSVVGCNSERRSAHRYKLPKDPDMRLKWVQFLFEVNRQQLKESSWTDITICSEHFTLACYDDQTGQLKPLAVPSVCIKSEPEEQKSLHVGDSAASPSDDPEQSRAASTDCSGVSNATASESNSRDNSIKREEPVLLLIDKTFLLSDRGLLKLFVHKCPSCDSQLQLEQFAHDTLVVVNQECQQCNYRFEWKSQVSVVPTVEQQTGDSDETSEVQQGTPVEVSQHSAEGITVPDEEATDTDESEELSIAEFSDTDEEWAPDVPTHELCTDCGMLFNKLRSHTCEHKIKPLSCNICGKRCINEQAMRSHSRIHNVDYEFRCKYCSATFKTKADKMTHEVIHATEEEPYRCPDCSETFESSKERNTHLEIHRGPRQSTCDICSMDFINPTYLQRHMAVHTGLKEFKCEICDRAFNQQGHLKSHMRLHTGERPYKCQYCDKCFNHNVSLKSHVQRYHPSNSEEKSNDAENDTTEKDTGHDIVEEEQCKPKFQRRRTGRPKGRPKNPESGTLSEGHTSNSQTRKLQRIKSKRRHSRDDESEDTSDGNWSASEENRRRKRRNTSKSTEQPENGDPKCSQNNGESSPKRRGRPRKKVEV